MYQICQNESNVATFWQKNGKNKKNGNFEKMAKNTKIAILGNFFWFVDFLKINHTFFWCDFT